MGFAGQVFAARVAIGLAVPSRKALQNTGSVLAAGVKGIHRMIARQAMKQNLDNEHRKKLKRLNNITTTSAARTSNLLRVRLEQNITKLNAATNQSIAKSFNNVKNNYAKLKEKLSKPIRQQVFAGMQGLSGMKAAQQMARNMANMSKRHRREAIDGQRRVVIGQKESLRLLREQLRIENAKGQKGDKAAKQIQKELKTEQKILDAEVGRLKILKLIGDEIDEITDDMEEQESFVQKVGDAVGNAYQQIKDNFNDALRNSVALLAAFGYKLQQSTSELIEFEKELLNANSVFNLTNDQLFTVGNEIIKFGNEFGIATQNGATGLYQLASAGLSANDAMKVLPETLKLSMAVQGDHNTISKLTAQTLFGFGMEMNQAAEVTDKFAYAIQKSLIEYQDLSSAVKFALPFFTSTGQSIDQLLGALQILTNRALEAGIAGRGLRQALAEFAESAMDAEVGFRKMGVEILNSQGEMMQLTEIASQFAKAVGPDTASNTELLTTLIQDLNVRGATAFIHLVQASDEFTEAVENTANAGGQLDEMVRIQNQALSAQIQILKTNVFSIFAMRDAAYEGTEFINGFHEAIVKTVTGLKDMIVVEEDGTQKLTELGQKLQDLSIVFVEEFDVILQNTISALQNLAASGQDFAKILKLIYLPLKFVSEIFNAIDPKLLNFIVYWKMINSVLPLTTLGMWGLSKAIQGIALSQIAVATTGPAAVAAVEGLASAGGAAGVAGAAGGTAAGAAKSGAGTAAGAAAGAKLGSIGPKTLKESTEGIINVGKDPKKPRYKFGTGPGPGFKTKAGAVAARNKAAQKVAPSVAARVGAAALFTGRAAIVGGLSIAGLVAAAAYYTYKHINKEEKSKNSAVDVGNYSGKNYEGQSISNLDFAQKASGGYLSAMAQGGYPSPPPMAQGGFPKHKKPYLVGEQGPELFMPDEPGQLLNNGATQNSMSNGMVMKNVTFGIDSFGGLV